MNLVDAKKFPPRQVNLKDGRKVRLRFLRTDDGERLADFYARVPREARRFYWPHPLDREHALANAAKAESPLQVVLVMETPDGEIGGYAWYRWKEADAESSTFGICVRPDCQGCGAGRALMQRLLYIADRHGPPVMKLTCQHANARAVELYRRMGFRVVREGMRGECAGFPPEPQYWMERRRPRVD